MKSSTLIALQEAGELPIKLLDAWKIENNENPLAKAFKETATQKKNRNIGFILMGICIMELTNTLLVISTNKWQKLPVPVFDHLILWSLLFILFSFSGAVILLHFSSKYSLSEFGSQLEKLGEVLGLTYGEMSVWRIENLRERAEHTLYEEADYVKSQQGPNGEHSLSPEAELAREKYKRMHETLFAFGLCEEKWDRYWKVPEPENKKGEVVSDTA